MSKEERLAISRNFADSDNYLIVSFRDALASFDLDAKRVGARDLDVVGYATTPSKTHTVAVLPTPARDY